MKLARKIILVLLATFLALLGVLGYFEARRAVLDYDARNRAELISVGRALRPAFLEVWQVEGEARALEMLERANRDDLELTMTWQPAPRRDPELQAHGVEPLTRGEIVSFLDNDAQPQRMFVVVPVATGAIEVSKPIDVEHALAMRIVETRVVWASIVVLVAALVSVLAGLWLVGRPMRTLTEQARRIGAGDLAHRLYFKRKDEIGELADQMNDMCDRLIEANARIAQEAEARIRAVEQLRHADRLRTVGTLASGMAHELGTPLSIVAGRAKMIATSEDSKEDDRKFARVILGQAERMTKIMRGLLDFARRKTAPQSPGDLREVVRRTVELLGPLAKKGQVELSIEAPETLADVNMDGAQVEQALANLVVNGIHAMPEGGQLALRLDEVDAKAPADLGGGSGRYVRVAVKDQGVGIRKEDLPRVFEPFFTTKDVGEGTGLGLSVVHGILSDHGGWIEVESEADRGTTFSLYFPKAKGPAT